MTDKMEEVRAEDMMQAIIELYHICATCGNGFMKEEAESILEKLGMSVEPAEVN